jgi:hypothetical protein
MVGASPSTDGEIMKPGLKPGIRSLTRKREHISRCWCQNTGTTAPCSRSSVSSRSAGTMSMRQVRHRISRTAVVSHTATRYPINRVLVSRRWDLDRFATTSLQISSQDL